MNGDEKQKVYHCLNNLNISYIVHEHPAVFTVEEAQKFCSDIPGIHCKNLFLRNKKGNKHYLFTLEETKPADLKSLCKKIGETSLSFASPDRLYKYLGLTPGSVSPFGLINDENKEVVFLLDKDLTHSNTINFHPNINTATINLSFADFEIFLNWCENKVLYI